MKELTLKHFEIMCSRLNIEDTGLISDIYYSSCLVNPQYKNKSKYLKNMRELFKEVIKNAKNYRNDESTCNELNGLDENCKSVFEKGIKNNTIKSIDERDDILTFYPRGTTTPGKDSHLTSLLHLLVVPNPNAYGRIYNAVNLGPEDNKLLVKMVVYGLYNAISERPKIIERIEKIYRQNTSKTFKDFLEASSNNLFKPSGVPGYPDWNVSGILPNITKNEGETDKAFKERYSKGYEFLKGEIADNDYERQYPEDYGFLKENKRVPGCDLDPLVSGLWSIRNNKIIAPEPRYIIGFHVHPNHSVGHLHMHIIDLTLLTNKSMHNVIKTIPWNYFCIA